ncbi:RNA 2',3'-cyclic phosphodiesterase, partial [Streptomyces zhihengii]
VPDAAAGHAAFTGGTWRAARLHLVGSDFGRGPGPIRYGDIASWPFEGA